MTLRRHAATRSTTRAGGILLGMLQNLEQRPDDEDLADVDYLLGEAEREISTARDAEIAELLQRRRARESALRQALAEACDVAYLADDIDRRRRSDEIRARYAPGFPVDLRRFDRPARN